MLSRFLAVVSVAWLTTLIGDAACAQEWGNLKGKFVYTGEAETPVRLPITRDNECCDQYAAEIVDQTLLLGEDNELTNVFVWLRASRRSQPKVHSDYQKVANSDVRVDNTHCMFYPHAAAMWAPNQTLVIENFDPIAQAAKIDTLKNAPLNATLPINGVIRHKFEESEPLPLSITCGVHPWETARLLIHDNPYFAISGKDGTFEIKNLPVGEWEFQFWHEKAGYLEAKSGWRRGRVKLEIKPGENDLGTLEITPEMME